MSEAIVVHLPDKTRAALDAAIREEGVSENELIERALRDYLFIRKFRSLREQLMSSVSETYTDQDVFDRIS